MKRSSANTLTYLPPPLPHKRTHTHAHTHTHHSAGPIHVCDMTPSEVDGVVDGQKMLRDALFPCGTCPIHKCDMIHMCDVSRASVWHDTFTCVTCR